MGPFRLSAYGTPIDIYGIFQRLSCHPSMPRFAVGHLLLGDRTENRVPNVCKQGMYRGHADGSEVAIR